MLFQYFIGAFEFRSRKYRIDLKLTIIRLSQDEWLEILNQAAIKQMKSLLFALEIDRFLNF
jgi:hypothetical protein